jgi:hypothetical protein
MRFATARPSIQAQCPNFGRIAQLVEQLTLNQRVQGSSPCAPTTALNPSLNVPEHVFQSSAGPGIIDAPIVSVRIVHAHLRRVACDGNELVLADPDQPRELRADALFQARRHPDRGTLCTDPLWVARRRASQEGFELIEGSCFWAVGPKAVIGVELDPHCHLTEQRVRGADIIICFKEYPHIDFLEHAEELVTLVVKAIRRDIRPVMSVYDCRMIDVFPTTREPRRAFVTKMTGLEARDGVLSVSLGHGF